MTSDTLNQYYLLIICSQAAAPSMYILVNMKAIMGVVFKFSSLCIELQASNKIRAIFIFALESHVDNTKLGPYACIACP